MDVLPPLNRCESGMEAALAAARLAIDANECPVGCALVHSETGEVLSIGHNETVWTRNPSRHAEWVAYDRLEPDTDLSKVIAFITLEPCVMCAQALMMWGIPLVVFGACNPRFGGVFSSPIIVSTLRIPAVGADSSNVQLGHKAEEGAAVAHPTGGTATAEPPTPLRIAFVPNDDYVTDCPAKSGRAVRESCFVEWPSLVNSGERAVNVLRGFYEQDNSSAPADRRKVRKKRLPDGSLAE